MDFVKICSECRNLNIMKSARKSTISRESLILRLTSVSQCQKNNYYRDFFFIASLHWERLVDCHLHVNCEIQFKVKGNLHSPASFIEWMQWSIILYNAEFVTCECRV